MHQPRCLINCLRIQRIKLIGCRTPDKKENKKYNKYYGVNPFSDRTAELSTPV